MWNLKNKTKFIDAENRLVVARGEGVWEVDKMGEGSLFTNSSYKINNPRDIA